MTVREIPISSIHFDPEFCIRSPSEQSVVETYVFAIEQGDCLPPLTVFQDGEIYWLADGYLRLEAFRKMGRSEILVEIYRGGQRDAILYSLGANASHGIARTQADKCWVIRKLLTDPEWCRLTNLEIAERCAVSDRLVQQVRAQLKIYGDV